MALCFVDPADAIRAIADSIGREARRQLLGEAVRAWVDEIPDDDALASGPDVQYPETAEMTPTPTSRLSPLQGEGLRRGSGTDLPRATPLMSAGRSPNTQSADHDAAGTDADAVPAQARG